MKIYSLTFLIVIGLFLIGCATNSTIVDNLSTADPFEPYQKGRNFYDQGRYNEAIQAFDHSLTIDPNFIDAHFWQGNAYLKIAAIERAIDAYLNSLEIRPGHAKANLALASIYYNRRQYPAAEEHFKRALATDPGNAEAYFYLAEIYHKQGLCEEPKELYEKALTIQPSYYDARQGLATLIRNNCRSVAAQPKYQKRSEFSGGGKALSDDEW